MKPSSAVYRAVLKSNPFTSKRTFYGNYGGSGNLGGAPVDAVDEIFRRHDIVYYEAQTLPVMKEGDRLLVESLEALDPAALTPQGRQFRETVIKFMASPMAGIVGKPVSAIFQKKEPAWSLFPNAGAVQAHFDPAGDGVPENHRETP